jgi:uroporphyrinogen-III synthase
MRAIVTRPERDAAGWVDALQARGIQAVPVPLIAIAPAPDRGPLRQAWRELPRYRAAMFVSANAVAAFFGEKEAAGGANWAQHAIETRAWGTGPGTARALAEAGVPLACIDSPPGDAPQFDSEALWRQVAAQVHPGDAVLLVRGAGTGGQPAGRDWLAVQLQQAGARVETVAAYTRELPAWTPEQRQAAIEAAHGGPAWLFSSSEAIANLRLLLPGQDWSQARAIATHERIAQAAREAGFGVVWPSRPGVEAIAATLESIG